MLPRARFFLLAAALLVACTPQRAISPIGRSPPRPAPISPPAPPPAAPPQQAMIPPTSTDAPIVLPESTPVLPELETLPAPVGSDAPVALLLPLKGPLSSSSEAIRDGFMAAHYARGATAPVQVYDTGNTPDSLRSALQLALSEGALAIVGPLRKEDVAALALTPPAVPVLALNYLDPGRTAPARWYQLGLSADDEAREAARDALAKNLRRALVLTPVGEAGDRTRGAFQLEFAASGGIVADSARYDPAATDHSDTLRGLLGVDASRERHRALSAIVGGKLQFEPRRRNDVDMVFFAARGTGARQLAPQLRFHRATGLPLYTTAVSATGEQAANDLNGVRFCDGPWMTEPAGLWADARNETQALFSERSPELSRLSALGYDAYHLTQRLATQSLQAGEIVPGATGRLKIAMTGVINRELSCVEVGRSGLKPAA